MSARRRPWPAIAFAVALLSSLADAPGFGAWGIRLPLLAAAAAALVLDRLRGPALRPDPLGIAAAALLGFEALSLSVASSTLEGAPALLLLFAGVVLFFHARSGLLPAEFARATVPLLVSGMGVVFSAIGLAQALAGKEAVSTLWNRNYSGTLAAMLLPVSGAFAAGPGSRRVRALHAGSAFALFAYLVVTDSRAGLVAAAAGVVVAAAGLFRRHGWQAVGGAALALLLLGFVPSACGRRPISLERLETAAVRLEIWNSASRMFVDRPLLGVGLGNFPVEYPPWRSFEEARISHAHETRGFKEVEDPHSSWVQAGVESGVPGLLAFLAVAVLGARTWFRRMRGTDDATIPAGLGAGMAAYLVGGLFNTLSTQPAHTALFWAFLGLVEGPSPPGDDRPIGNGTAFILKAGCGFALIGVVGGIGIARAEHAFAGAMALSDAQLRLAALEEVAAFKGQWRAHEARASALLALGRAAEAAGAAREALRHRPNGAVAMNTLAIAKLREGDVPEAEDVLRRALAAAPHCWLTHVNLGALEFERKNFAEAERHYALAERLAVKMPQLPYRRAETLLARDDVTAALEPLRRARGLGYDVAGALRRDHPGKAGDRRLAEFFR